MAMTVTAPEAISFSKDRNLWTFERDNEGYDEGTQAENYLVITGDIVPGTLITIRWGDVVLQRLKASATPDSSGNEFPSGAVGSAYAATLAAWLQKNYSIDQDFIVTSGTLSADYAVKFTARKPGTAYNILASTFTGGEVLNQVPGVNAAAKVNHSVFIEVHLEGITNQVIYAGTIPFGTDKKAQLDVGPLLHPHLIPEQPGYELPVAIKCTTSRRKYHLRYANASGENFAVGQLSTTASLTVVLGSLGGMNAGPGSILTDLRGATEPEDKLLSLQERTRYVRKDEPVFISWLALRAAKSQIFAKVTVEFADDSTPVVTNAGNINSVALHDKLLFAVGFNQLNLDFFASTKVVKRYTVQLEDADSNVAEPLVCVVDYSHREYIRYFSYINSYGALETLKTYGKQSADWKLFKETAESLLPYNYTAADPQYVDYNNQYEETHEVATGWILKRQLADFLDFFISPVKQRILSGTGHAVRILNETVEQGTDGDNLHGLTFEYTFARRSSALSEREIERLLTTEVAQMVPPGVQVAGNITIGIPSTPWTGIIDPYPTEGSDNPVASGGVRAWLQQKLNITDLPDRMLEFDGFGSGLDADLWRGYTPLQMTVGKALVLSTSRKIALDGAVVGEINFDGSSNQTITARIAHEVNFSDADVPVGVNMEVGGTTPVVNLQSNFRGEVDTTTAGGAMRVDTRGGGIPMFSFISRLAGEEVENNVGSISENGDWRYEGKLLPNGYEGVAGQVLKVGGDGNIWGNITFAELTSKPTTSDGFGITNVIKQGGNSFGAMLRVRTLDNQPLALGVNGMDYFFVNTSGQFVSNDTVTETPKVDIKGADILVNGVRVGRGATNRDSNLVIGNGTGRDLISAERDVFVGTEAAFSATRQSDSVYVGYRAGYQAMGDEMGMGWGGTYIGAFAGSEAFLSSGSIAIGNNAQLLNPNSDYQLSIGNWIYGQNGFISIGGAPDLARRFKVYGKGQITDQLVLSVANGTAPLLITSTTEVANLNSARLQSYAAAAFPRKAEAATITEQWTFGALPISNVTPSLSNHLATKGYVDSQSFVKRGESVMAVLTLPTTLHGTFEVAGYMLVNGDRVLVTAQTDPTANGIYIADGGGWLRATNADTDTELRGYYHLVLESDLAGQRWINTNTSAITVGTTNITYGLDFGQETDPTVPGWVKSITEPDILNWDTAYDRTLEVTYGHLWKEVEGNETLLSLVQVIPVAKSIVKPWVDIYGRVTGEGVLNISDVYQLQNWLDTRVALVDRHINDVRVWDNNSNLLGSFPINDDWATITGKPDWTLNDSRHPLFGGLPLIRFTEGEAFDETIDLSIYKTSYHSLENLFIVMLINLAKGDGLLATIEGKKIHLSGTINRTIEYTEDLLAAVVQDNFGNQSIIKILIAIDVAPPLPVCSAPIGFYDAEGDGIYEIAAASARFRFSGGPIYDIGVQLKTAAGIDVPGEYHEIHPAEQTHPLPPFGTGTNRPKVTWNTPLVEGQSYQMQLKSLDCDSPTVVRGFSVPVTTTPPPAKPSLRLVSSNDAGTEFADIATLDGVSGTFSIPEKWNVIFNNIGGAAYDYVNISVEELRGIYVASYNNSAADSNERDHSTTTTTAGDIVRFPKQGGVAATTRYTVGGGTENIYRNASYRVKAEARTGGKTGSIVGYKEATFSVTTNPPILKAQWATYQKVAGSYVDMTADEYMDGAVRKRNIDGVAHTIFYLLNDIYLVNPDGTPKPFASGDYPLMAGETIGIRKIYAKSSWVSTAAQLKSRMADVWTTPDLVKKVASFNLSLY